MHMLRTQAAAGGEMASRILHLAALIALVAIWPTTAVYAQEQTPHAYVAQLVGLLSEQDEKLVTEAVSGWEALTRYEVSRCAHRMKFSSVLPLSEMELTAHLAGTGVSLLWLAELQPDGGLLGPSYAANAFPVFEDTGDPSGDNARYDADKAAWLAAHPGWVDTNTRPIEGHGTQEADVVK